ncbi:M23 family metallopeptidase [Actibacterium sp. 188UL27-1]|uniref:M23 family metallopeptidase n=1 Tax=Actibacterium sp. 188UL27-1 TaxID=2786961 RepID=UPI001956B4CF|nr:M23 family metallopeptidase [Actibacterium sp. 188UL27-1]MBM7067514.1 peptidoglycan DD-metalloendopeptidase family protein [Actibacterium sp. 188UL27-1]
MRAGFKHRFHTYLERRLPEQRLFLRSDTETRFIRLRSATQAMVLAGGAMLLGWTIIVTAVLLMDSIGSGNARDQAKRNQATYETRLNELSDTRDARAAEAVAAQERFNAALRTISEMQSELLASEDRRRELETGIGVIQSTLRRTTKERDTARDEASRLVAKIAGESEETSTAVASAQDIAGTLDFLTAALQTTAVERDDLADEADFAREEMEAIAFERELILDRNDKIFAQLEEAVTVSVAPLDKMFSAAGLPPEQLIETVRRGYSGQGGPLTPLIVSTKGGPLDPDSQRANDILKSLDRVNLYRLAAQKAPFDIPVKSAFRYTSGFGPRWGRMHNGTDFAASHGTPITATADGVVIHAGWQSGYGRLIKIQHEFGIETRYAHLAQIRVSVGQRVSRGDRIGDMGNSGRSTGTHLHYEVRVGGKPVNPMIYIKAANDVF